MGWFEILIVALVALIVLGPDRLPTYARKASKFVRQFRKITSGVSKEINKALELDDIDDEEKSIKKDLKDISRSLEEDAAELRKSLTEEANSIQKTLNEGAREATDTLNKESAEISKALSEDAKAVEQEVAESVSETKKNLGLEQETGSAEAVVAYKPPPVVEEAGEG
jgi:sec-independent protein translocase protein TatB